MGQMERIDLLLRFLERSDRLRASYSSRAGLVLSANAVLLAASIFLLDKSIPELEATKRVWLAGPVIVGTAIGLVSAFFAILAAGKVLRGSTRFTGYDGKPRLFLHPSSTRKAAPSPDALVSLAASIGEEELMTAVCGELWVALRLQDHRYGMLRLAVLTLITAYGVMGMTFVITTALTASLPSQSPFTPFRIVPPKVEHQAPATMEASWRRNDLL